MALRSANCILRGIVEPALTSSRFHTRCRESGEYSVFAGYQRHPVLIHLALPEQCRAAKLLYHS